MKKEPKGTSKSSGRNAYDLLINAIEDGEFSSGSRLREDDLAHRFGISRTPIREALKRLEAQGLVSHAPYQGAVVSSLSSSETNELYQVREVLDGMAARLAAVNATAAEVKVLEKMLDAERLAVNNPRKLAQRYRIFSGQIYLMARNRFLSGFFDNLRMSLIILSGTAQAPLEGDVALNYHSKLVRAIAAHDAKAAEATARAHMRAALKARLALLAQSK